MKFIPIFEPYLFAISIDNKIDKAEGLKDFDYEDYKFAPKESTDAKPVFRRKEQWSECWWNKHRSYFWALQL